MKALAVTLGVLMASVSVAQAKYSTPIEIAPSVICQFYETEQDVLDHHQAMLKLVYESNGDVLLDETKHDGYDRVLFISVDGDRIEMRWRKGTYCFKITPLPKQKQGQDT